MPISTFGAVEMHGGVIGAVARGTRSGRVGRFCLGGPGRARFAASRLQMCAAWAPLGRARPALRWLVARPSQPHPALLFSGTHTHRTRSDRPSQSPRRELNAGPAAGYGVNMRAMVFDPAAPGPDGPLRLVELSEPTAGPGQVLLDVLACGVCRTDLHVVDQELGGEAGPPKLPVVPGHQVVGRVTALGEGVAGIAVGDRVGVPWLGHTCGHCGFCTSGQENLCDHARFTGYQLDGGMAERMVADARYCFPIGGAFPDVQVAPLLCAGLIGWRCLRMANETPGGVHRLGLYGFGASAHILCQIATWQGIEVVAFTRPGDTVAQDFARSLGAAWAGPSDQAPPAPLDAAVIFAPVGPLVPEALSRVRKGGTVVCGGIHMSEIPAFAYDLLWGERAVRSVANLTRRDGEELLALAPQVPVRTEVQTYALSDANRALDDMRHGRFSGAAVLVP